MGSWCIEHIRSVYLGMDRESEWLLSTLSILHISAQTEATILRLGSWCTEYIMSVNLSMDGQSEWELCTSASFMGAILKEYLVVYTHFF